MSKYRAILVCGVVAVLHSTATAASLSCENLAGSKPYKLFNLSKHSVYVESTLIPLGHVAPLHLAYITPAHPYTSGVVIIKTRNRVESVKPQQNPLIKLHRDYYRTPCRHDAEANEFNGQSDTQRYINYHYYGLPDNYLDQLHADLGNRPRRVWYESNNRCASTSDWDIAPQFLFSDDLAGRTSPNLSEYLRHRVTSTYEAATGGGAFAAPASYSDYQELSVQVKPYRKQANGSACIDFWISKLPRGTQRTDLMIIDADDARYPRADLFADPQKTWSFEWQ